MDNKYSFSKQIPTEIFDHSETIIFDLFGLLIHPLFDEKSYFYMLLSKDYHDPDFSRIRGISQNYLESKNEKFDIYNVYTEMKKYINLKPDESARMEMDNLEKFSYLDFRVKKIMDETIPRNIKKILINDTIYPNSWILHLLQRLDIDSNHLEITDLDMQALYSTILTEKKIAYICKKENVESGTTLLGDYCVCFDDLDYWKQTVPIMDKDQFGMSPLIGRAYNSMIMKKHRLETSKNHLGYDFGYDYGGMYCIGYASWIFDVCKNRNIDKVLFLARDGYSLIQVFKTLYGEIPAEYAMWSRSVAARSCANLFPYYFFSNIFYSRRKKSFVCTVYDMLKYLGIEGIEEYKLHQYSLETNMELGTDADRIENFDRFTAFSSENMDDILIGLFNEREAAKSYYQDLIGNCKNIAVVDTGYSGSNLLVLKHAIENEWVPGCSVLPLMAGVMPRFLQGCPAQLLNQEILAYMFSPGHNTSLMYDLSKFKFSPIFFEAFAASPDPSVTKIKRSENGTVMFEYDETESNNLNMNQWIHQGILDFTNDYEKTFQDLEFMNKIPGSDVGLIAKKALEDQDLLKETFANYHNYINMGMPTSIENHYPIEKHIR